MVGLVQDYGRFSRIVFVFSLIADVFVKVAGLPYRLRNKDILVRSPRIVVCGCFIHLPNRGDIKTFLEPMT